MSTETSYITNSLASKVSSTLYPSSSSAENKYSTEDIKEVCNALVKTIINMLTESDKAVTINNFVKFQRNIRKARTYTNPISKNSTNKDKTTTFKDAH